jgi:hypothetical protein
VFGRDVAQDFAVRGHRHVVVDVEGLGTMVVRAVHHKANLGLHRPADKNPDGPADTVGIGADGSQNSCQRAFRGHMIDDDPQRTIGVMPDHQDHRLMKP